MRCISGLQLLFIAALAALVLGSLAASAAPASGSDVAKNNGGTSFMAAPFCCKGCQYDSGCCCPARNKVPIKRTKTVKRTRTKLVTVTAKKVGRRLFNEPNLDQPEHIESDETEEEDTIEEVSSPMVYGLEARHLCPACPAGSKLVAAKNNNKISYCCPARKTVMVSKTRFVTKTKTVTQAIPKITVTGRVFYDVDKNNVYTNPPDKPIANTVIYLVIPPAKCALLVRAEPTVVGQTKTNAQGVFIVGYPITVPDGTQFAVVKDVLTYEPLLLFETNKSQGQIDVPVLRPAKPTVIPPATLSGNIATVVGTGEAGLKINLYCSGKACGQATVEGGGQFTISSSSLAPGTYTLAVAQMDVNGAESDLVDAGFVTVLATQTVPAGQTTAPAPVPTTPQAAKSTTVVKNTTPAGVTTAPAAQTTAPVAQTTAAAPPTTTAAAAQTTTVVKTTSGTMTETQTATTTTPNSIRGQLYYDQGASGADSKERPVPDGFEIQVVRAPDTVLWNCSISGSNGTLDCNPPLNLFTDGETLHLYPAGLRRRALANFTVSTSNGADLDVKLAPVPPLPISFYGDGSSEHGGHDLAVDDAGNVYAAMSAKSGATSGFDYDWGTAASGKMDGLIVKYSGVGNDIIWVARLVQATASCDVNPLGIAVSTDGKKVYVTGTYDGSFSYNGTTIGASTGSGDKNGFVLGLDGDTGAVLWMKYLAGSGATVGRSVAVDSAGDIYVGGHTDSTSPITVDSVTIPVKAGITQVGFIVKLGSTGTGVWAKATDATTSGSVASVGTIKTDGTNIWAGGYTDGYSPDINFAGSSVSLTRAYDGKVVFVAKLNPATGVAAWFKVIQSGLYEVNDYTEGSTWGMTYADGKIYVTGMGYNSSAPSGLTMDFGDGVTLKIRSETTYLATFDAAAGTALSAVVALNYTGTYPRGLAVSPASGQVHMALNVHNSIVEGGINNVLPCTTQGSVTGYRYAHFVFDNSTLTKTYCRYGESNLEHHPFAIIAGGPKGHVYSIGYAYSLATVTWGTAYYAPSNPSGSGQAYIYEHDPTGAPPY